MASRTIRTLSSVRPLVIVSIIIALLVGVGIGYVIVPSPAPPKSTLPSTIPIGVMVTLTGSFSSYGARAEAAAKVANTQINDYVKSLGIPTTFNFLYEDTQTSPPSVALTDLQTLYTQGVKVVVGGMTSGEMAAIDSFADTNHIVVIDGTSTAGRASVAPPGDYEFRDLPAGGAEGAALTAAIMSKGYKNVAMITASDTYTLSIRQAFKNAWLAAGGNLVADVNYSYPATTDFTVQLNTLQSAVAPLMAQNKSVAIFANMWEDVATMLAQAKSSNSPLLSLTWFGNDNFAQDNTIISNAGAVVNQVKLVSVVFAAPLTPTHAELNTAVNASIGQVPDIYACATYDAAWIAALSILTAGQYNGTLIKTAVPTIAGQYYGATGNTALNSLGDRNTMDMDYWAVVSGTWQEVATYSSVDQSVTWLMAI
jgi:branched-chain amino acid transport system substrate-binding protein